MIHPLDPLAPLKHSDGTDYTEEQRYVFFEAAEQSIRNYYKSDRANYFNGNLSVGDQLDMLWHEVNENGSITNTGEWFNAVKNVKDTIAKERAEQDYQKAVADVLELRKKYQ